jgi:hypothetical protein
LAASASDDDNKSGKITTSNDGKTRSQNKNGGYQSGDLSYYHPQWPYYQATALRETIDGYEFGALSKWLGARQPSQKQKAKELFTSYRREEYINLATSAVEWSVESIRRW